VADAYAYVQRLGLVVRLAIVYATEEQLLDPWTGDQLVARSLPVYKHRITHILDKTSMP
jgi:hypothetical protein